MRVGIVTAKYNTEYTEQLRQGALDFFKKHRPKAEVVELSVPGAFELPLGAKHLLESHFCDFAICYGVVIKGETDHYDYVCRAAQEGCLSLSLELETPVGFGVLTVHNHEQIKERLGGKKGHKGFDVAKGSCELFESMDFTLHDEVMESVLQEGQHGDSPENIFQLPPTTN